MKDRIRHAFGSDPEFSLCGIGTYYCTTYIPYVTCKRCIISLKPHEHKNMNGDNMKNKVEMMQLYTLTREELNTTMSTMYGKITGKNWYKKEKNRISSQPGRSVEIKNNEFWVNVIAK